MYTLGFTIHHQTIVDDMVRVMVINIWDGFARIHMPIEEFQTIG